MNIYRFGKGRIQNEIRNTNADNGDVRNLCKKSFSEPTNSDLMRAPSADSGSRFHLNSTFQAQKSGLVFKFEGLRRDIAWLFSLPIPQLIWEKTKVLQNDDFVAFVEQCRNWK